jgi:hypothetical protein
VPSHAEPVLNLPLPSPPPSCLASLHQSLFCCLQPSESPLLSKTITAEPELVNAGAATEKKETEKKRHGRESEDDRKIKKRNKKRR